MVQKAFDVVTYGEPLALLVAEEIGEFEHVTQYSRRIAGAEINVAIGLARLGLRSAWFSRIGNDSMGRFACNTLKHEGVDIAGVEIDPLYHTGFQLKAKTLHGEDPKTEYYRKGSATSYLSVDDFNADYFSAARHLHATGIVPALSDSTLAFAHHAMDYMRAQGKTISFDPNLRPSLWASKEVMAKEINRLAVKADWVLPGIEEGELLTGYTEPKDIARFYLDQGVKRVVIKLGPVGAYYCGADGEGIVPGVTVEKVVDTVGAGDGFAVGVVSGLLEGCTIEEAVARGNHIGACAIQVVGDMEGLPTRAELNAVMTA